MICMIQYITIRVRIYWAEIYLSIYLYLFIYLFISLFMFLSLFLSFFLSFFLFLSTPVIQKFLRLTLVLDLSHTSYLRVGFTYREIQTEIWISNSKFYKKLYWVGTIKTFGHSSSFSERVLKLFERSSYLSIYLSINAHNDALDF